MKNLKEPCTRNLGMKDVMLVVSVFTVCILTICGLTACGSSDEDQSTISVDETVAGVNSEMVAGVDAAETDDNNTDSRTWEELYQEATEEWLADNYVDALAALEQAIEKEANAESVYLLRARIYYDMAEEIEVSEETIENILELYENARTNIEKMEELISSGEAVEDADLQEEDLAGADAWNSMITYAVSEAKSSAKNVYGSTLFLYRETYQEFDDFSADQQAWLETLINACINQNVDDVVMEGLDSIFESAETYYTTWDQYKIWFSVSVYSEKSAIVEIEIRQENGTGYYVSIDYDPEGSKYSKEIIYTTSTCVDWQWNGEYNSTCTTTPSLYEIAEYGTEDWIVTTGGTMKNNLRTGTFTSSNGTCYTYDENGLLTDTSQYVSEGEYHGTIRYERVSYTEEYGLEMLYW